MAFQLPEGLDKLLAPDVYQSLISIHSDKSIDGLTRRRKLDELFRKVPDEIKQKMPLPPHLAKIPTNVQEDLKKIFYDNSLSFEDKAEKSRVYIKGLPEDVRKTIAPPGFENLPEETRKQFREVMEKDGLTVDQRHAEFKKLIDSIPADQKAKVPGIEMWS